jgi:hypothetical protein
MSKRPRKPRERIDAEAARELLSQQHPETDDISRDENTALWWQIQRRITAAAVTLRTLEDDEARRWALRATEICDLHMKLLAHPEDSHAAARRDELLEEIAKEALTELLRLKKLVSQGKLPSIHHNPAIAPRKS